MSDRGGNAASAAAAKSPAIKCPSCKQHLLSVAALEAHLPECAAARDYFRTGAAAGGGGDGGDWVDVASDALLPQTLHEGMLAIRERVFIVQQWKVFWAVLHPTDISWYLDNQLRGKIDLATVEFVEDVAAGEKLSPP
jgi:hypothetical protein